MPEERVVGIARSELFGAGALEPWRGVRADHAERVLSIARRAAHDRPRRDAEDDPTWKQLIPYLVVRDGERIWLMRRTRAGADARLHDRFSIGVGGHLDPADASILDGLRREFDEELVAPWEPRFRLLGVLNDDDDPVGRVHLGLVYEVDAAGRPVAIRETHKLSGEFATIDEVQARRYQLETWSQLVLDHLLAQPSTGDRRDVG